jgi:hypothetical protein
MSGKQVPFTPPPQQAFDLFSAIKEAMREVARQDLREVIREVVQEEMKLATERPMNLEQMAKFLDRHQESVKAMARKEVIRGHKLEGCKEYYFFASEVVEDIKRRKK